MDLNKIHEYSIYNEESVRKSKFCGCFYCQRIFKSTEVVDFLEEPKSVKKTAWCPYCNIDSVLGDYDVAITHELLGIMYYEFFKK